MAEVVYRRTVADSHSYPVGLKEDFECQLEQRFGVPPGSVLVGNGSDGLMAAALRALLPPGGRVLLEQPGYDLFDVLAGQGPGLHVQRIPAPADQLPGPGQPGAVCLLTSSPQWPTGRVLSESRARELTRRGVVVLVDQAYAEYVEPDRISLAGWVHSGAVVFRTMSKFRNRGDLRIGWAVGQPETIARIRSATLPFPCGADALRSAMKAVDTPPSRSRDLSRAAKHLASVLREKGLTVSHTDGLPWVWCRDFDPPVHLTAQLSALVRVVYRFEEGHALKV